METNEHEILKKTIISLFETLTYEEQRKILIVVRAIIISKWLSAQGLKIQWLVYRLYADHGLSVNRSGLSHILSGERVSGEQTETVIKACEEVMRKYEDTYRKEA